MVQAWEDAVRRGDLETLRRLVAEGHGVDARDRHGQTALMIAARDGRTDLVSFLIEQGADLDHTAKYGLSALMLAVVNGHARIVEALERAGADLAIRGTGAPGFAGKTAFDLAVDMGRRDIADLLRLRGGAS